MDVMIIYLYALYSWSIKGPTELVTIVKPNEILSPSLYVWCGMDQKYITAKSFSNPTPTKWSSKADHGARWRWPWTLYWRIICWSDDGVNLYTGISAIEPTVNPHHWQLGQSTRRRCWWPLHRRLTCPHDDFNSLDIVRSFANAAVSMHNHN
jgi:hypothetical protein